jgi:methylated-DNA-[protein]-cysteine S-methyltransferase
MSSESRYIDLFGGLTLVGGPRGLRAIDFNGTPGPAFSNPILLEAERQLREYFAGERFVFDLELDPAGTPFQRAVWSAVAAIPYGETRSYRDIATAVGRPKGFRAMGQANGRNPLPIVIPCHRVINTGGALGGYGGGLDRKKDLLKLEQTHAHRHRKTTA